MIDDGFGPLTSEDVHLEARIRITTGDGKEIANFEVEEILRNVVLEQDPTRIRRRFGSNFHRLVISPIQTAIDELANSFRSQPANPFFGRIDPFFRHVSHLDWWDTDPMEEEFEAEAARRIEQFRISFQSTLLDSD